jgi:hypothetical protein
LEKGYFGYGLRSADGAEVATLRSSAYHYGTFIVAEDCSVVKRGLVLFADLSG